MQMRGGRSSIPIKSFAPALTGFKLSDALSLPWIKSLYSLEYYGRKSTIKILY